MTTPTPPTPGNDSAATSPGATGAPASPAATSGAAPAQLDKAEAAALQLALRSENAALWSYSMVTAHAPEQRDMVTGHQNQHLSRRDAASGLLVSGGQTPEPPAPAYRTPEVKDPASAHSLAIIIETDCARAWRNVIGQTDSSSLRAFAAEALAEAAVRLVQWRQVSKATPLTSPFPGALE